MCSAANFHLRPRPPHLRESRQAVAEICRVAALSMGEARSRLGRCCAARHHRRALGPDFDYMFIRGKRRKNARALRRVVAGVYAMVQTTKPTFED